MTRLLVFGVCVLMYASSSWAVSLVTTDVGEVAAFQAGATVLGFDELPPNGGGGSFGNTGVPIEPGSQLTDQYVDSGIVFSSTAGPVGVVSVEGLSNEADATSPFNLIGGSSEGSTGAVLDYFQPITLNFVLPDSSTGALTSSVGAWNDPTGSRIRLSVYDVNGNLLESVEADEGFFVGISNPLISSATFSYVINQSVPGFALDDVTFGTVSAIPLPSAVWLLGSGILGLVGVARHNRAGR